MADQPKKAKAAARVRVQLPKDLKPIYSNFAMITNSPSEIVIDFAQVMPQIPEAKVQARVIMTPRNAKLLLRAIREHLGRFEAQYGEIDTSGPGPSLADQLFRPPSPESPDSE
ncbi:MAG: DUF3467 domain-containing protein [Anaerolineales bacterium]|jgi:hypothetical protein